MEKIILYHRLFFICLGTSCFFLGISVVVFVRLKVWEIIRFFRRNRGKVSSEAVRFRLGREIMLIHTNEMIE